MQDRTTYMSIGYVLVGWEWDTQRQHEDAFDTFLDELVDNTPEITDNCNCVEGTFSITYSDEEYDPVAGPKQSAAHEAQFLAVMLNTRNAIGKWLTDRRA